MTTSAAWIGSAQSGWTVEQGRRHFSTRKELNTRGTDEQVLSLTLRGVVRNDPDSPEGLVPTDYNSYQVFGKDDLVFKLIDLENRRTSRVGLVPERGVMSPAYIRLIPKDTVVPRYAYWYYYSLWTRDIFNELGGGVRATLSSADLLALPIALPPMEEQWRIADFLDDQVARIEATSQYLASAMEGVESRASVAVLDAIGFDPGASERPQTPGDLVSGSPWPLVRLSLLARLGTGHTPSRSNPDYWQDCHIPWLTTSDIHMFRNGQITRLEDTTFHISDLGLANSAAVVHPAGTIAMSRTASVGFSIEMGTDMATSQDFVTWTCGPRLKPHYLLALLRATRDDLVRRLSYGSTHKTIYFPDVMSLRIPLPPLDVQEQILGAANEARQWRTDTQAAIARAVALLEERKRSLITAAVTGEMDVTTAKPISMGRWVPGVGADVPPPATTAAPSLGGI